jgi:hypothetical protein
MKAGLIESSSPLMQVFTLSRGATGFMLLVLDKSIDGAVDR